MLKPLRWRLTFLYLLAAIGLVGLVGIGTYFLINSYFQQSTDLALQYKMAAEFRLLGLSMPKELVKAEELWLQNNSRIIHDSEVSKILIGPRYEDDEAYEEYETDDSPGEAYHYEADLAAIFIVSFDANGDPILVPNLPSPPIVNDPVAFANTEQFGYDIRTVDMPGQGRIRLLTYKTNTNIPAILQTGHLLSDQDGLLNQYLISLIILGGVTSIILALISWWLAGRSLGPAQKAWDQQQVFVSNASHELRTPLTLIRATADYGLRNQPAKEQSALLTDILNECDYMDRLVDDLLLLSRLDAQRLQLDFDLIPLQELFSETLRLLSKLSQNTEVSIQITAPPIHVRADRTRLRQVLLILLDNALRFTPSGGTIQLSAQQIDNAVQIDVIDTGQGIPPEHLPHLFDRFYQVSSSENEGSRTNGLGLSIAHSLIEAQGGSITISSQLKKGTQVRILFPGPAK
ncbi:MAG: HAMP domain-containing histidine kinase [Anaerolineae bacterium]|jgi:signal transduction histidine kinase|nr:HAMP domain-containing histidine kinase [Anaerolineae bacterium]MBT3712416.1 HAMP domain-containing histidine kinase [Anaerolineae bacterium]MBT4309085.1 HAMP domain-containing histidine kinase [Anaerolineae bacterium]MBT4457487.1 HAMP domain-containing histidine kinase [Anaerolineae bacterium]MBT6060380.1 HAMP domain-containing histidine kinase [Anaerolineae bacterium]